MEIQHLQVDKAFMIIQINSTVIHYEGLKRMLLHPNEYKQYVLMSGGNSNSSGNGYNKN